MQHYDTPALEITDLETADIITSSNRSFDVEHFNGDEETYISLF